MSMNLQVVDSDSSRLWEITELAVFTQMFCLLLSMVLPHPEKSLPKGF